LHSFPRCCGSRLGLEVPKEFDKGALVSLRWCSIGDSGAIALAESLRSCISLQSLDLRDNFLTDASIKSISEVITTVKSLKILLLRINNFTEGGRAQLRQAAEDRKSYPDFVELDLDV